jgi:hypothetical protein
MRTLISCLLFLSLSGCAKFDDKISTRVKGTIKYADGSPASGVYVKLVQVFKAYEGTGSSAENASIVEIVETNEGGDYEIKFKDDPRPEGYPKDFSDYFLCISKKFIDDHSYGESYGFLSTTTQVEFLRSNDFRTGEKKNKIKTGRKNRIDAIIKN